MQAHRLEMQRAVVLTPELGDDPEDLEDRIHDEVRSFAAGGVTQVVLDLSAISSQALWLKAAGPEIPDTSLRIALGEVGYRTARALRLDAHFEWYPDVESALRALG